VNCVDAPVKQAALYASSPFHLKEKVARHRFLLISSLALLFCALSLPQQLNGQPAGPSQPDKTVALADTKVRVERIRVTGNTVIGTEELDAIVSPYSGKDMALSDLQKIAELITDAYRKKGYSIARAYIPQQEIKEGVVEIAVLEGRVGEIVVKGNGYYSTEFIRRHFTRVIEDMAIKHSSLETSLLLLNENPDLKATAILQAGKDPGTTDIIVNVEDKLPLHLGIDYNNFGSEFVSRHRFGAEVVLSKFLIIEGASLSIRGVMGSDPSDQLFGRASYIFPINGLGTKVGLASSGGNFVVGREFAELGIEGRTWSYSLSLTHPLMKTRFQNLTAEFGFESRDTKQFLLDALSSRDKIRLLKAGLNYDRSDNTGRNFIWLSVSQGLGEALGGMENNDPKASRSGADNRFTRANLILARFLGLPNPSRSS
jgi:hemolysin activation/secretion protein